MRRFERYALAALACAPVAACNAIAGLGDFQEVPCQPCADAASGSEAGTAPEGGPGTAPDATLDADVEASIDASIDGTPTDAGGDAASDVVTDAPETGASFDRRWALWIMPNSATDDDAGFRNVDAATADGAVPNPAVYSAGFDGGVFDVITHITWAQSAMTNIASLSAAEAACASVQGRLPTRIELVSILDTSRSPTANPVFTIPSATLWTDSTAPNGSAWTIDFRSGAVTPSNSGTAALCILVLP